MKIVIKTNSHYRYLWDIISDFTKSIENIVIFTNDKLDYDFNKEVILYDQSLSYTDRIVHLIENIDSEYFLLIHDVDLILNLDVKKLYKYLDMVIKNNIDRLSLGVFNNKIEEIVDGDISICKLEYNMSKNFFTPFDYAPSIYKKVSAYSFYKKFSGESYRNLELNPDAQAYINDNFKSYGIQKNDNINIVYHRGFAYSHDFNFLHITVGGLFLEPETYFDLTDNFLEIKSKYKLDFISTQYSKHIQKNELI